MFRFALLAAVAEADVLSVTWKDCGAKHATVTDVSPSSIHTGATETITGTGTVDEDVTSAQFTATVSALGAKLTDCSGDATTDIVCTLPMGVGKITVKAVPFPLKQGTVEIPVEVQTSSIIPASLASVDVHIAATDQNGEDTICLDVHTDKQQQAQDEHPHLSQAWQANSVGDGQPDTVGLESYIYEDCDKHYTETCMRGHVFDYGASCTKYEVDMGIHSKYTGTYYVNCQSVNCCKDGSQSRPDPKKWDIGQSKKSEFVHFGTNDIEDLDGAVAGADTWNEVFKIPIVGITANYTYYITQSGDDVISHRIDFSELSSGQSGQILYGQFVAKHADELDAFRQVFQAPDECLKPNTLKCNGADTEEWDRKFFRGRLDAIASMPKPAVV